MNRFLLPAAMSLLIAAMMIMPHVWRTAHPKNVPAQSWDQENLKRDDRGCPTAIFVAPRGELVQCELFIKKLKVPTKKDPPKFFPTADAAALYVVSKIYERSHYYEYGGVIGKGPEGYALSQPRTQHHGEDVEFSEDPESYNFPIVATYHVHPCIRGAIPSVFSPQDLAGARTAKTPAYVLDECTGALHYWAPGDGYLNEEQLIQLDAFENVQLSPGKIVGHIKVDGAVIN